MAEPSEASRVYLRFKDVFGDPNAKRSRARRRPGAEIGSSVPFGAGRDPRGLSDTINSLTLQLGWNSPLAQSELLASWTLLAGEETSKHSTPVGIDRRFDGAVRVDGLGDAAAHDAGGDNDAYRREVSGRRHRVDPFSRT